MKSLEARFTEIDQDPKHDGHASLIKFYYAVKGGHFTKKVISKWFNKLVERGDYDKKDKLDLLEYALKVTEEGRK